MRTYWRASVSWLWSISFNPKTKSMQQNFFLDLLADNSGLLPVRAESKIVQQWPDKFVLASRGLELTEYQRLGHCKTQALPEPRPLEVVYWGGEVHDQLYPHVEQVIWDVSWESESILVVHLEWNTDCGSSSRDWIVASSQEVAERFVLDIARKTNAPNQSILVFSNGRWSRSRSLFNEIQKSSLDDLVLPGGMKETIGSEFKQFLESEDQYKQLGISWRRGALFTGPPGNGKTHCVKALVRELGVPVLYVQSLSHNHYTSEQLWQMVFDRARKLRPCVLVLEDLDSLVDDTNRSFFLNQLDGFEENHGLIVLATTNHPERIDVAIVDRPSRFDRKYQFGLPADTERQTFLESWQRKLAQETGWEKDEVSTVVAATEGFSFAYLKELVVSAIMDWLQADEKSFAKILKTQAELLGKQVKQD